MIRNISQALVLAPHPDDAELGCGATIARLLDADARVTILMLSDRGEPSWFSEALEAAKLLAAESQGIAVETLHLTVFHFPEERQTLLRQLEHWRDELEPDVVLAPADGDTHQDHETALKEARRAFKGVTLLTYEIMRSTYWFCPRVFVPVSADQVRRKAQSVACYATQRGKRYTAAEAIEGLARNRGAQCDADYAEAFGAEWIVL